jgi:GAF domain-containing protein
VNNIRRFFSAPVFENEQQNRSSFLLNYITIAYLAISALTISASFANSSNIKNTFVEAMIQSAPLLAAVLIAQILLRLRQVQLASISFGILLWLSQTYNIYITGGTESYFLFNYLLAVMVFGLLLGRRYAVITAFVSLAAAIILFILGNRNLLPESINSGGNAPALGMFIFLFAIFLNTALLSQYLRLLEESVQKLQKANHALEESGTLLEQRVEGRTHELEERTRQLGGRTRQLEAIAGVARSVASIQELKNLLPAITQLVSQRFGFYHVGIFIIDEDREFALLQAANSAGGQDMLRRGHRLKVGEQGLVGFVTFTGNPRIALDVGDDAVFFNNPDLPDTHSEVTLPLKFGNEIIGALDIQSKDSNAFSQEDLEILTILADQASLAIQNARSLEQAQRALREAEIASSQLTAQTWKGYTEKLQIKGYRYDGVKSDALKDASNSQNQKDSLSIPLQLRGQTIGHLKLKASDATRKWTDDERAIIESTAERVAIAVEGARLLDEAQKRATRETFLSELSTKLGTSFQLDSILRDTVEELGQTLKGSTVSFQLVNPSAPPTTDSPKADDASARRKKAE